MFVLPSKNRPVFVTRKKTFLRLEMEFESLGLGTRETQIHMPFIDAHAHTHTRTHVHTHTHTHTHTLCRDVHSVCSWDEKASVKIHKALEQEILAFIHEAQQVTMS